MLLVIKGNSDKSPFIFWYFTTTMPCPFASPDSGFQNILLNCAFPRFFLVNDNAAVCGFCRKNLGFHCDMAIYIDTITMWGLDSFLIIPIKLDGKIVCRHRDVVNYQSKVNGNDN